MTCERCRGWMVRDRFVDLSDDTGRLDFDGWRCINCGEVLDVVVLQHRRNRPLEPYRSQRRWGSWVARNGWLNRTMPSLEARTLNMQEEGESG